jgi:uncharacterized membrane protein YgaE (UPF0421/DUF939 family)
MKFAFEIKMEPVTQASIIVAVIAFSSGSLATIAICARWVVLAFIVYLTMRFSPR